MEATRRLSHRGCATGTLVAAFGLALVAAAAQAQGPALISVYPLPRPKGLMVTTGGWAYCTQVRRLARRSGYTLLCGRYWKDGYTGPGLRSHRHLDWGDPGYLDALADAVRRAHSRVGGSLLLIGVSYSGFGVAALASRHPELHPDRLIVIDSYLDLVARRRAIPPGHETGREIDAETGGSPAALAARSVSVGGLARLVQAGTELVVVWSTSAEEEREFRGATCNREANAATLARLAQVLGRPVAAWVTKARHGHDLWNHGAAIIAGRYPGRQVLFQPTGRIPPQAVCDSVRH
jgi:hypothetical protein